MKKLALVFGGMVGAAGLSYMQSKRNRKWVSCTPEKTEE